MKYKELSYYGFGLAIGVRSIFHNGFRLGFRNTSSSILQPVNSYTRFPEYHVIEQKILSHARSISQCSVLDIGSPKLLGLYLAYHHTLQLRLTDIDSLNTAPYQAMWEKWAPRARGHAAFQIQDVRQLEIPSETFDIVYCMSVLEHIEGKEQDRTAVREMLRVLKPNGLLLISVPYGQDYIEQTKAGRTYGIEPDEKVQPSFFQRIYDREHIQSNVIRPAQEGGEEIDPITIFRRPGRVLNLVHWLRAYLPESLLTVLGFLNPLASITLNQHQEGIFEQFYTDYGIQHSFGDIYGDLVLSITKRRS